MNMAEQEIYRHLEEHNDPQNCGLCDVAEAIKEAEDFLARLWHLSHHNDPEHCFTCAVEQTIKDAEARRSPGAFRPASGHTATEVGQ
jgi:DNA-binding transcriptional regulator PaaX